jgi:hypothetical protein
MSATIIFVTVQFTPQAITTSASRDSVAAVEREGVPKGGRSGSAIFREIILY